MMLLLLCISGSRCVASISVGIGVGLTTGRVGWRVGVVHNDLAKSNTIFTGAAVIQS